MDLSKMHPTVAILPFSIADGSTTTEVHLVADLCLSGIDYPYLAAGNSMTASAYGCSNRGSF